MLEPAADALQCIRFLRYRLEVVSLWPPGRDRDITFQAIHNELEQYEDQMAVAEIDSRQ